MFLYILKIYNANQSTPTLNHGKQLEAGTVSKQIFSNCSVIHCNYSTTPRSGLHNRQSEVDLQSGRNGQTVSNIRLANLYLLCPCLNFCCNLLLQVRGLLEVHLVEGYNMWPHTVLRVVHAQLLPHSPVVCCWVICTQRHPYCFLHLGVSPCSTPQC